MFSIYLEIRGSVLDEKLYSVQAFAGKFFLQLPQSSSEGWVSGLNQHIANVPYTKVYRGFESLSLRQISVT